MALWQRVWVLDGYCVDVNVEMPPDLSTAWRMVVRQVRERLDDQRARARADSRSRLGISVYQPLNGRPHAAAEHDARVRLLAEERAALAEDERLAVDDWRYYEPQAIRARVERASEAAILTEALAIAAQHGVAELPRWRTLLQQSGHQAAESRWRAEVQAALQRLRGDFPPRHEQVDPAVLRRQLDDVVRDAAVEDLAYRDAEVR